MTYLIGLVIAIAITGTILFLYSSSLNERAFLINNNAIKIENEFLVLKNGYNNKLVYSGTRININNWESDISRYVNIPNNEYGYNYLYNENANGNFFCLYKENENMNSLYFESLKKFSNINKYAYIATECGEVVNQDFNNEISKVAVTYYVGS